MRVLEGQLPLRDFYGYPPLRYWYLGGWFQLLGASVLVERIALLILGVLATLLMFLIARRTVPSWLALVPTAMVMVAPSQWIKMTDTLMPFLTLWLLLRYLDRPTTPRLVACGFVLGVMAMVRHDLALAIVLVHSLILWVFDDIRATPLDRGILKPTQRRLGRLGIYWLAVGLGLAPFVLVYGSVGALPDLIGGLFASVSIEATYGLTFFNPLFEIDPSRPLATVSTLLVYVSFLTLILFPIGLWIRWRQDGKVSPELAAVWLTAWAAYPVTFLRPVFTRITQTAQLTYLLGTIEAAWLIDRYRRSKNSQSLAVRRTSLAGLACIAAVPLAFFAIVMLNNNIFLGSVAIRIGRPLKWEYPQAPIYESAENTGPVREVTDYIVSTTRESDRIFAAYDHGFYFLSRRPNATGHYFIPSYLSSHPGLREEFLSDLENAPARVIVRRAQELAESSENPTWWHDYIAANYVLAFQNEAYVVYERVSK
jgi:hypothetical protein